MKTKLPKVVDYSVLLGLLLLPLVGRDARADATAPRSFESVQAEIEALEKEDVAWRKIAWKTCLLDGLHASREQNKPIILWIFIDRPVDDERC